MHANSTISLMYRPQSLAKYFIIIIHLSVICYSATGTTNTQQALELIRDDIFNSANGDRDNADNFVFLITDGKPNPFNMNSLNNVVSIE